jgi:hypothetical protein
VQEIKIAGHQAILPAGRAPKGVLLVHFGSYFARCPAAILTPAFPWSEPYDVALAAKYADTVL